MIRQEIIDLINKARSSNYLDLSNKRITDAELPEIMQEVKKLTSLFCLKFYNNQIGDTGAKVIAENIGSLTSLKRLGLNGTEIGDIGAKAIVENIGGLSLTDLFLYNNEIGDIGAKAIGENIESLTSLTYLGLSGNEIGDIGAKVIWENLGSLTSLKHLEFGNTSIGDTGAEAIGKNLGSLTSLTYLCLGGNAIGDIGAKAIGENLGSLTSLTHLFLYDNEIGDIGAKAIVENLGGLTSLTHLYLYDNNIQNMGHIYLLFAICCNKGGAYIYLESSSSSKCKSDIEKEFNNTNYQDFIKDVSPEHQISVTTSFIEFSLKYNYKHNIDSVFSSKEYEDIINAAIKQDLPHLCSISTDNALLGQVISRIMPHANIDARSLAEYMKKTVTKWSEPYLSSYRFGEALKVIAKEYKYDVNAIKTCLKAFYNEKNHVKMLTKHIFPLFAADNENKDFVVISQVIQHCVKDASEQQKHLESYVMQKFLDNLADVNMGSIKSVLNIIESARDRSSLKKVIHKLADVNRLNSLVYSAVIKTIEKMGDQDAMQQMLNLGDKDIMRYFASNYIAEATKENKEEQKKGFIKLMRGYLKQEHNIYDSEEESDEEECSDAEQESGLVNRSMVFYPDNNNDAKTVQTEFTDVNFSGDNTSNYTYDE